MQIEADLLIGPVALSDANWGTLFDYRQCFDENPVSFVSQRFVQQSHRVGTIGAFQSKGKAIPYYEKAVGRRNSP